MHFGRLGHNSPGCKCGCNSYHRTGRYLSREGSEHLTVGIDGVNDKLPVAESADGDGCHLSASTGLR